VLRAQSSRTLALAPRAISYGWPLRSATQAAHTAPPSLARIASTRTVTPLPSHGGRHGPRMRQAPTPCPRLRSSGADAVSPFLDAIGRRSIELNATLPDESSRSTGLGDAQPRVTRGAR